MNLRDKARFLSVREAEPDFWMTVEDVGSSVVKYKDGSEKTVEWVLGKVPVNHATLGQSISLRKVRLNQFSIEFLIDHGIFDTHELLGLKVRFQKNRSQRFSWLEIVQVERAGEPEND